MTQRSVLVTDKVSPDQILNEYRKLIRIRKSPKVLDGSLPIVIFGVLGFLSYGFLKMGNFVIGLVLLAVALLWYVFTSTPKSTKHKDQYLYLEKMVQSNQNALYELIFSGKAHEEELQELIWFGGHGGSIARDRNTHWAPFIARVRARKNELPISIQSLLDWQERVHGW